MFKEPELILIGGAILLLSSTIMIGLTELIVRIAVKMYY